MFDFSDNLRNREWRNKFLELVSKEYAPHLFTTFIVIFSYILLRRGMDFCASAMVLVSGALAILFCGWKGRAVYLGILGVITCIERHFILHYGDSFREIGTQALITLHITDRDEVVAYLAIIKLVEYLLPLLFLAGILLERRKRRGPLLSKWNRAGAFGIVLSLVFMAMYQTCRPVGDYLKTWNQDKDFYMAREQFRFHAKDAQPDTRMVCILVIGESHRKKEFDELVLGGERAPFLKTAREKGELWEFDDMITHYQQTWYSVFTLLTRRGGETQDVQWREKGLIELFKEAGFSTYYLTYQRKNPSAIGYDYVVNEANVYFNHRNSSGSKFDEGMLPELDRILKKDEMKVLVVIKMVGCHFHFQSRFPANFTPFTPCYTRKRVEYCLEDKPLLVNTYKNAMSFNAAFFDKVAMRVRDNPPPSFMIFLSDHGIINYDDGKNTYFGATKSNFHIPCFIYGNQAFRKQLPAEKAQALAEHRNMPISNTYIFDTIVSLAGIQYPEQREELDLTSPKATPALERKVWVWKQKLRYDDLP